MKEVAPLAWRPIGKLKPFFASMSEIMGSEVERKSSFAWVGGRGPHLRSAGKPETMVSITEREQTRKDGEGHGA